MDNDFDGDIIFRLSRHASRQAEVKGIGTAAILRAAAYPTCRYENRRVPGQMRHIRGDIVTVIADDGRTIVTVYANVVETAPRADQRDADSQRYAKKYYAA